MKTAFVKQQIDMFGAWATVKYRDVGPQGLFDLWPSKASLWQATVALEADWYVIPQQINTEYTHDIIVNGDTQADICRRYMRNVVQPDAIPYEEYDVVIANDPVLTPPRGTRTLFAYYMNEHWDITTFRSLHRVLPGYDLFLAHVVGGEEKLRTLPQSLRFPYIWETEVTRKLFASGSKDDVVWVDYRTVKLLSGGGRTRSAVDAAVARLVDALGIEVRHRGFQESLYRPADPPLWGDARNYFLEMASCKYYLGVGRTSGGGQSLVDAASLGAICFGEKDKPYHPLLCHPACLCDDMADLPRRVRAVVGSRSLQEEVMAWQEEKLRMNFIDGPITQLAQAVEMKRSLG